MTATAMITMAFVYTGLLQYCANDIDRVAFCPVEQTIGTSKQTHTLKLMLCIQKQTISVLILPC